MAHITKAKSGWRAQIDRKGVRASKTFPTKEAARAWSAKVETEILAGGVSPWPRKTVGDAFDRYAEEVSPGKRSGDAEVLRLIAIRKGFPELASKLMHEVQSSDVAAWRDARLKKVSKSSVQRDANLLRNVWNVAAREWKWTPEPTPWRGIKMPGDNPPRQRIATWREIKRLLRACGFVTGQRPSNKTQEAAWAFLIGCRTCLRAGELLSLTGETVSLARRVVTLETHKTSEKVGRRVVPLAPAGVRLLGVMWRPGPLFDVTSASLDTLFRKMRDSSLIADLHFHDSRATGATHLARRVDVMTLARITGHQDLRMLLEVYYRESPEQIAARLASPRR